MNTAAHPRCWRTVGASVRGARHVQQNKPLQDNIRLYPKENRARNSKGAEIAILAVADGHGSERHLRSAEGADLAVSVLRGELLRFWNTANRQQDPLSRIKWAADEGLAPALTLRWGKLADARYRINPLSENELEELAVRAGATARTSVEQNPLLVYGSTLLGALLTNNYAIFVQLGDGDLLLVDDAGTVTRVWEESEPVLGEQTTSLCTPDAWRNMKVRVIPLEVTAPALVLAATDGYGKSFRNEPSFLQAGSDLIKIKEKQGLQYIADNLTSWLEESARMGSGDDVTVALAFREDGTGK